MIKGSIQEVDIALVNIPVPDTRAPKYIKQIIIDIKGEMDNAIIIVWSYNTPLASKHRPDKDKISKATLVSNDNYPIGLDRYLEGMTSKNIRVHIFSSPHGIFSRIVHILDLKTKLVNDMKLYI